MAIRNIEITRNTAANGKSYKVGQECKVPQDISEASANILIRMKKAKDTTPVRESAPVSSGAAPSGHLLELLELSIPNLEGRLSEGDLSIDELKELLIGETDKEKTRDGACKAIQDAIEVLELDERLCSILKASNLIGMNVVGSIKSKIDEMTLTAYDLERLRELEVEQEDREEVLAVIDEAIKSFAVE